MRGRGVAVCRGFALGSIAVLVLTSCDAGNITFGYQRRTPNSLPAAVDSGAPPPPADSGEDEPLEPGMPMQPELMSDAGLPLVPCIPADSAEPVPARDVVSSADARPTEQAIFTADIFGLFKSNCGGCHADTNRGMFQARTVAAFPAATKDRQQLIHDKIRSDDPKVYMPPPGTPTSKPWSQRDANDPVVELANLLDQWFAAGSPGDLFYVSNANQTSGTPYLLPQQVAANLTNIGNCLPNKRIVALEATKMDGLDAMFAAATSLPEKLEQTDLVTFDSETLARNGVISFAPAYPLFSDNARKMRHVRVPRGESIAFDKQTQEFTIPANTRFYKTFLKKVIDKNGNERYRKIETRLIVSRPDGPDADDGSHETKSLFGSYAWNDDESEATLVIDPLRNGQPFRDRLFTYITDEAKAEQVLAMNPYNKVVALRDAGATRNYAIPGSDRCIQCHMGSHNRSFALGFTPIQINRRASGEGGTYEETSDDELKQLQRLIDYGVITGVKSPDDILPLEKSQGDRKPRNDYELAAQGYMLGNCSHCHNPRGFPTTQNPVLKDLLRFFPDHDGGIFQFPLDRTSPRIKRGARQDVLLPYITPSIFDLELSDGTDLVSAALPNHTPKWLATQNNLPTFLAAPWRSLIYRNVDTPFTYAEDYALYPHMPLNAVGFDCRAPKILGDWMISIPARPRFSATTPTGGIDQRIELHDSESALYDEVKPEDHDYAAAVTAAKRRLDLYHKGGRSPTDVGGYGVTMVSGYRYSDYCPDTSDIVDADVQNGSPADQSMLPSLRKEQLNAPDSLLKLFATGPDGIPDRANWVVTDFTESIEPWSPRRSDWASVLVDQMLDGVDDRQKTVVGILQGVTLSDAFKSYVVEPEPFGLWKPQSGCDFSSVPKVSSFTGDDRPLWMDVKQPNPAPDDPVYMQSPGATVFNEICINCHGAKFDSRGRQADTLFLMTGGDTRVANLRDGLIGKVETPGSNRAAVFDPYADATKHVTGEDWAARYVAWMGLGGTQRVIPTAILNVVSAATVLGQERPNAYNATATSANMLSIAQTLCGQTIGRTPAGGVAFDLVHGRINHDDPGSRGTSLIASLGDAEMWLKLCGYENAPPVRVARFIGSSVYLWWDPSASESTWAWYESSSYPSTAQIGDQRGDVTTGLQLGNTAPWCLMQPDATDTNAQTALAQVQSARGSEPLPMCPTDWFIDANRVSDVDLDKWTLRGAMNAGMSVFLYLDKLEHDALQGNGPQPPYDDCQALQP